MRLTTSEAAALRAMVTKVRRLVRVARRWQRAGGALCGRHRREPMALCARLPGEPERPGARGAVAHSLTNVRECGSVDRGRGTCGGAQR